MSKLPQNLRLVVNQWITDSDWDLNSLMNVTDEEIDAIERAVTVLTPSHRQSRNTPTAAVLTTPLKNTHTVIKITLQALVKLSQMLDYRNRLHIRLVDVLCVSEGIT